MYNFDKGYVDFKTLQSVLHLCYLFMEDTAWINNRGGTLHGMIFLPTIDTQQTT